MGKMIFFVALCGVFFTAALNAVPDPSETEHRRVARIERAIGN